MNLNCWRCFIKVTFKYDFSFTNSFCHECGGMLITPSAQLGVKSYAPVANPEGVAYFWL